MNSIKKITPILICILVAISTNAVAQENNNSEEEPWFWSMISGLVNDVESWVDHSENIYEDMEMKIDLNERWKFNIGDNNKWSTQIYDDYSWEKIIVPGDWENDGFHGYDGYAWYRIHFNGQNLNPKETHFLILGFIDDVDETFLNGDLVGTSGTFPPRYRTAYDSNRKYYISNDQINFHGDNTIAVRVYDEYANGGIVNGKPGIYVSQGDFLQQNLSGIWKFSKTDRQSYSSLDYDDTGWENMLVPSYWDNHGYRSFDGTAWYRKTFTLNFDLDNDKQYYLILGKIDDWDETYINGEKIGETKDGRILNKSTSYEKIRIYKIPKNLLNFTDTNTIAVKVHDLGVEGGIYKGPIGIIDESDLTKIVRR
jgi:sialate O-acetylesterase